VPVIKALIGGTDLLTVLVAMAVAQAFARRTGQIPLQAESDSTWLLILLSLPVWGAAFVRQRLYQARFVSRRSQEFRCIVAASAIGAASLLVIPNLWRFFEVQRDFVVFSLVLGVGLLLVEREIVRRLFSAARRRGHRLRRVVIVGDNAEARELRRMFDDDPSLGYEFVGYVTVDRTLRNARPHEVLGNVDDIIDIIHRRDAASVMIAASAVDVGHTNPLIRELLKEGVHVELSPTLPDIAVERLTIKPLGRFPVMYLEPFHQSGWRSAAKRAFDFCASAMGLTLLAIPLLTLALLIKVDSRGPIFYTQTRVGRNGRLFKVCKFRTMVPNAHHLRHELAAMNEADGPLFKIKHDPRVTRMGRLLRKTSLDELPQLWNVLRGEMSLVGPRPALPEEARLWDPELRDRLRVQPGITGMWQVSGRSNASFDEYSRLDLYYVDNWSLLADLSILAKTVPAVLAQRGAS
jgi:exopolysaccharide biosynthesis polyprenyl glycosylphosphotransferase